MNEIKHMLLNPEEAAQLEKSECMFLNVEQAKDLINSCGDPVDQEVLWTAYATLTFRMAPIELAGKFDVLFFIRVVSQMLKDRDQLQRMLSGDITDNLVAPEPLESQVETARLRNQERTLPLSPSAAPAS